MRLLKAERCTDPPIVHKRWGSGSDQGREICIGCLFGSGEWPGPGHLSEITIYRTTHEKKSTCPTPVGIAGNTKSPNNDLNVSDQTLMDQRYLSSLLISLSSPQSHIVIRQKWWL